MSDINPFSPDGDPFAPQASASGPLTAQAGDTLNYARGDSGQDLEDDGPGGPGTLRLPLRPWTNYTVGDGSLSVDLATRLLQDGVCVKS